MELCVLDLGGLAKIHHAAQEGLEEELRGQICRFVGFRSCGLGTMRPKTRTLGLQTLSYTRVDVDIQ